VLERDGTVTDKLLNSCTCGAAASQDALWMTRAGPTVAEAVVRVALDPANGRFAAHQDTIYSGRFSNLSVTADGSQMVVDDGSYTYSVIAAKLPDLLRGKLPDAPPLLQASSRVSATVSPDGERLLMRRSVPGPNGPDEIRLSVAPFTGGAEAPLNTTGSVVGADWIDSVTALVASLTGSGLRLTRMDVRSGAVGATLQLADSTIADASALPNGWAWIPKNRDRVIIEQDGQRHEIPKPAWFVALTQVEASPDGRRLLVVGWGAATNDTLRLDVVPTAGGATDDWWRSFAENGFATWLDDGSVAFTTWSSSDAATVRRVTGPGQVAVLGTVGHVASGLSLSRDLARATIVWRDYRGDAWMYRVVKP
jgi:hypothetical protein